LGPEELRLEHYGLDFYRELARNDQRFDYHENGVAWIIRTIAGADAIFTDYVRRGQSLGAESLDPANISARAPIVHPGCHRWCRTSTSWCLLQCAASDCFNRRSIH
jgi:hypothetical protein